MDSKYNPLTDTPPEQIPLNNPPLIRVLAQISFPPILSVEDQKFIAPFQEAIRRKYPNAQPEHTQDFLLTLGGANAGATQTAWRFTDLDNKWRVSLTSSFLSLETRDYLSRTDLVERLTEIVSAAHKHIEPQICTRIGLRYITRLSDDSLSEISSLIKPEMLGVHNTILGKNTELLISQAQFSAKEGKLLARWGNVPANSSPDLSTIEPLAKPSWILDLDMSTMKNQPFDTKKLVSQVEESSSRIYAFFRWSVTEAFLKLYKK